MDCIEEARRGLEAIGCEGEILVVDNGSVDATAALAAKAGARVVEERRRGYGSALGRGIREATGDIIILGDADGSYRFDSIEPLVAAIEDGADLVVGSRLGRDLEPGAMPWLHRRVGTPAIVARLPRH